MYGIFISIFLAISSFFLHHKAVAGAHITLQAPTPTATITSIPSENPTAAMPTPVLFASPTPQPNTSNISLSSFFYPGASQTGSSSNSLTLQSTDDANTITGWYENTFANLGFHGKNVAKTNSNGNILNKLASSKDNQVIEVEINKNASSPQTTISVTVSSGNSSSINVHIQNSY